MGNRHIPYGAYERWLKRPFDICGAFVLLALLSPVFLILTVTGAAAMGGDPFFVQPRPGKGEKLFPLIKYRTMSNERDADGVLLSSRERLTPYGRILRATSLDELPELVNILKGDMSFVGPRPLLAEYLPLYNEEQRLRHSVRPGLTGYAQIHGRNAISWERKFELDGAYVRRITFWGDVRILLGTVKTVLTRSGIAPKEAAITPRFTGTKPEKTDSEKKVSI